MPRPRVRLAGAATAGIFLAAFGCAALAVPTDAPRGRADDSPLSLPIAVDGPAVPVRAAEPGRLVRLAFTAKAGQRVDIGLSGVRMSPASASALVVTVRGPQDELVSGERIHCFAANTAGEPGNCDGEIDIGTTGKHVVEVDAPFSAAAAYNVLLSSPAGGSFDVDHPGEARLRRIGQDARFELRVASKGDISVEARHAAPSEAGEFKLKIFQPDGTLVAKAEGNASRGASAPLSVSAGSYIVEVDPDHGAIGTFTLSARTAAAVGVDGAPIAFATSDPSEVARIGFEGRAGEDVVVAIDGLKHEPDVESNSVVSVLQPDGSRLAGVGCFTREVHGLRVSPCKLVLRKLPVAGHYRIAIKPPPKSTASGRVVISEVVAGSIAPGTSKALRAMKLGQVASYMFDGKAGQSVGVDLTGIVVTPAETTVSVTFMRPGGGWVANLAGRDAIRIKPIALPANGTYTIVVDPGLGTLSSADLAMVAGEGKLQ